MIIKLMYFMYDFFVFDTFLTFFKYRYSTILWHNSLWIYKELYFLLFVFILIKNLFVFVLWSSRSEFSKRLLHVGNNTWTAE